MSVVQSPEWSVGGDQPVPVHPRGLVEGGHLDSFSGKFRRG